MKKCNNCQALCQENDCYCHNCGIKFINKFYSYIIDLFSYIFIFIIFSCLILFIASYFV